jgi:hypothetical protein
MEGCIGDSTTMKRKYNFLWIDDYPKREQSFATLKRSLNVTGKFENVLNKNIAQELDRVLSDASINYDLIMVDHFLENTPKDSIKMGSTVAEYIRERKPDCPIIGITGAEKLVDIDFHKKYIYEDIFKISSISQHYSSILAIAKAYRTLINKRPAKNEDLIRLLKTLNDDKERLIAVMPEDIKRNYKDKSLLINISKWVRHVLMARPGFLYDELWTATLLGLKKESFNKVNHIFEGAKYSGIFADEGHVRWWQTAIRQTIFSKFPEEKTTFPWQLGRKLAGISRKDYSTCHVCGKEFPETVGYTDEEAKTTVPMHFRCSIIHPKFESTLYYDDIRMMVPAK